MPRRSKRTRTELVPKSALRLRFAQVAEGSSLVGCIKKMAALAEGCSEDEIRELGDWGPLVVGAVICGSRTSRDGNGTRPDLEDALIELVAICHQRGISADRGGADDRRRQRPLVVAAYYGLHRAVRRLLQSGASPDLADGRGKTALYAALKNPSGQRGVLRDCDRQTAEVLFEFGAVTSEFTEWRSSPPGSLIYINGDSEEGSAMLSSVIDKNTAVAALIQHNGGILTDRDYLALRADRKSRKEVRRLLPLVASVANASSESQSIWTPQRAASWAPELNWSFPPTWRVAVGLCRCCGLPGAVFREHVVPFLSRDWFYSPEQLDGPVLPLMGSSLGDRDIFARGLRWKERVGSNNLMG